MKRCFSIKSEDEQKLTEYFKIDQIKNHQTVVNDGNTFVSIFENEDSYFHIFSETTINEGNDKAEQMIENIKQVEKNNNCKMNVIG